MIPAAESLGDTNKFGCRPGMQAKWVDECQAGVAHNWAKVRNQGDINHIQAARQSLSVMTNDDLVLDV